MIEWLDAFLMDRVFQPIADWLEARDYSVFAVSQFTIDGCALLSIGSTLYEMIVGTTVFPLAINLIYLLAPVLMIIVSRRYTNEARQQQPGMLNPFRQVFFPIRIMALIFAVFNLMTTNLTRYGWIEAIVILLWFIAVYLLSCSRRPPLWKKTIWSGFVKT